MIDPAISGCHARVEAQEAELTMVDAGTRHGTWVNGGRLGGPCPLRRGDTVRLGDLTLRAAPVFGSAALAPPGATTPAAPCRHASQRTRCRVYRTPERESGASPQPVYELGDDRLYRTPWHARGPGHHLDYKLRGWAL